MLITIIHALEWIEHELINQHIQSRRASQQGSFSYPLLPMAFLEKRRLHDSTPLYFLLRTSSLVELLLNKLRDNLQVYLMIESTSHADNIIFAELQSRSIRPIVIDSGTLSCFIMISCRKMRRKHKRNAR